MSTFELYSPLRTWKKGDYPISPFIHLSLGHYSQSNDGHILLGQRLMTNREIDDLIEQLKNELENFRKEAKQHLIILHERMLTK